MQMREIMNVVAEATHGEGLAILDLVDRARAAGCKVETFGRSHWHVTSCTGMPVVIRISQESGVAHRVHLGKVVGDSLTPEMVRRLLGL